MERRDGVGPDGVPRWAPEESEFVLGRGDRVYIRRAPGYEEPQKVKVTGEVMIPGEYQLGQRDTRVTDLLARAGGLTDDAYGPGFQVIRDGRPVAVRLDEAMDDPGSPQNILLQAGDSIHVPLYDGTVEVSGAVLVEAKVLYQKGRSVDDYIERAGGYADNADAGRVVVTYPNGERAVERSFLFFRRKPRIQPGSHIFIPTRPKAEASVDWDRVLTRTLTIMSTVATVLIAVDRVGN
jgi:protein involved in polysaccharide export with SLBB domain